MTTDSNDDDLKVGFKNPPVHSRFQKGTSGNPKGRPKRGEDYLLALAEVLQEYVQITENGSVKKVSKLQAIFMRLAGRAASGDMGAIKILGWWHGKNVKPVEEETIFKIIHEPVERPGPHVLLKVARDPALDEESCVDFEFGDDEL